MVAYRFCRPDDIPLLVSAVNRCYDVHFPAAAPLTVDGFRREVREERLWPSNCMVATAGDEPVAVVLGTKTPQEVHVRRIGVAPGHQRRGHGRHLLESLGSKLAVLGPPRLVAEVPVVLGEARAFFAALGWTEERWSEETIEDAGAVAAPDVAPAAASAARVRFVTEARPA